MSLTDSNYRVLRYVQIALETIGLHSHQITTDLPIMRWHSESTNILTWMLQVCAGLKEGERTSTHQIAMPWLKTCPKNLIVSFLQGLAESDGNVDKYGYYADISSIPNSNFYKELFDTLTIDAHPYPKDNPQQVRILLLPAVQLPLFNPIIRSYRYEQLMQHTIRRKLIPPPPSSFFLWVLVMIDHNVQRR